MGPTKEIYSRCAQSVRHYVSTATSSWASNWKAAWLSVLEVRFCIRIMVWPPQVPSILCALPIPSSRILPKPYKEFSGTCTFCYGHFCSQFVLMELAPPCGRIFFLLFLNNACLLLEKCLSINKKNSTPRLFFSGKEIQVDNSELLQLRVHISKEQGSTPCFFILRLYALSSWSQCGCGISRDHDCALEKEWGERPERMCQSGLNLAKPFQKHCCLSPAR